MSGAGFQGFPRGALGFFERLAADNTRDWFQAHKAEYEETLKAPMMALLEDLSAELAKRDIPLTADPKRSIMRINRDVRFARDKSPYKTNIAAGLTRDGARHSPGMLYLHFAPEGSFAGAGFYELERDDLAAFRHRIASRPDAWRNVEEALGAGTAELAREGGAKRLPQGFATDLPSDIQDAVKLKFFVSKVQLTPSDVCSPKLVSKLADFAGSNMALFRFGWASLERAAKPAQGI